MVALQFTINNKMKKEMLEGMKFSKDGLSQVEVTEMREQYGKNELPKPKRETFFQKFMNGLTGDLMIILLVVIAVIKIVMAIVGMADIIDPLGIVCTIILICAISAKTEMTSDDEFAKLEDSMVKDKVKVIRDGAVKLIDDVDVVVGDLVVLQNGDKVPADGYIVEGKLSVDNSVLNGETEANKKVAVDDDFEYSDEQINGDTITDKHLMFSGSIVLDGEAKMVVTKVGVNTVSGKTALALSEIEEVDSPLKVKLDKLAKQISVFGIVGAIAIVFIVMGRYIYDAGGFTEYFYAQQFSGVFKHLIDAISLAIVIIVAAVPEGLSLMISLVLMQNSKSMYDHNVLVRKAVGLETAGSINVLFCDKTGTITKGTPELVELLKYGDEDKLDTSMIISNNCEWDGKEFVGGNITDKAIAKKIGNEKFESVKLANKVIDIQEFNSVNKYSAAQTEDGTFFKGAPEKLLKYTNLSSDELKLVNERINKLTAKSMRVIAFAYSKDGLKENTINDNLELLGIAGFRDDVRPEIRDTVREIEGAGIQVVMITGDREDTAVAIAKDAGLVKSKNGFISLTLENKDEVLSNLKDNTELALSSSVLGSLTDDEVVKLRPYIRVISRALPEDKLRMVKICLSQSLVVGMGGDGTNDSPALKQADVGFAMGSGTDAAKSASDIVILDNNLRSIKDAILYGRTIFLNILKFCRFQLVINVAAVMVSVLAPLFGAEEPLTVPQLLVINLCMDGLASMMLGKEPALKKYMKNKPIRREASIVSKEMLAQIILMGAWIVGLSLVYFTNDGLINFVSDDSLVVDTGYFVMFMLCSIINGFNVRTEGLNFLEGIKGNKDFFKIMGIMLLMVVAIAVVGGPVGRAFGCGRLSLNGWIVALTAGISMIPVGLLVKCVLKLFNKNK